jgi:cytosine/adenosine deaminase-related metal-dependent hydrolase
MHALTCFTGAVIFAGDDLEVIQNAALVVRDGRILEISPVIPQDSAVVDLSGRLLCPMFINAHTHVADTGAKELGVGLPLEQVVNPPSGLKHQFLKNLIGTDEHVTQMRHGLLEMLHGGVIALADFREQGLAGVRALRQAAQGLPLRVMALGRMSETGSAQEIEAEAHALLQEADGLGIRDVESYPLALIAKLREAYPQKLFAAHTAEDLPTERASRRLHGGGQAARLLQCRPDFLVHLTHTSEEELELLVEHGVFAVACPRSNGILGDGLPALASWARLGLHFGLGTDNMMFNSPDMLREMDYASRTARGLSHRAPAVDTAVLLKAATLEGARALKLDASLGSLAAGKEANFIAFDLASPNLTYVQDYTSAVVHRATTADIAEIFIRGEPLNLTQRRRERRGKIKKDKE